eukprot:Seg1816.3 transcript_id=Seg1816.3/GoldUCD/mRNA.D3Y31 product="hypothetical protein" protein_id=Seg1816.3/GoldUCD/D3Y31
MKLQCALSGYSKNWYLAGYSAMKVIVENACYISTLKGEQTPYQMEKSMEVSHAKFPTDTYWVKSEKIINLYKMEASEVGPKIAAHCAGYDMIFTAKFKKDSDVLKIVKAQSARRKRNPQSTDIGRTIKFSACHLSERTPVNCPETKIDVKCRMLLNSRQKCTYNLVCKNNMPYGWSCTGTHDFTLPFCCDYTCRP